MKEAVFCTEVVNSLKHLGHWAYKIPDVPAIKSVRFSPNKPADIILVTQGYPVLIECKQFKQYQAFGMRHLTEHQPDALHEFCSKGKGRAFIFINIRRPTITHKRQRRCNRLIIYEWAHICNRLEKESIKKPELEAQPYIEGHSVLMADGNKKMFFDLERFCACIWHEVKITWLTLEKN